MSEQFVGAAWVDSLLAAMESIGLDVEALVVGLPGLSTSRLEGRQRIDIGSARRLYHRADRQWAQKLARRRRQCPSEHRQALNLGLRYFVPR